ncbi:hypothetical protein DFH94DRAFT_621281 [Russula ochroleuca]|uniref:Beta-glucuronidase C-terminal domain-containing protein n=1 Tax=Russula ochroleuca TaxID=152965 RepID=A0A9P5TE71_9AGAM|nr:hypothetical protein DFH94DRAFT_621281 [Russula ochroleuca]
MHLPVLSLLLSSVGLASAQYTVYQPQQQVIFGGNTNSSIQGLTTASAAYDPTLLQAPTPPDPPVPTNQFVQLYSGGMDDLSMPLSGAFFGFSIEMSIATRVLGKNSSLLQVPFLNLMANIKERVGWVQVRVGGNTQESAELVQSLPNGITLAKDLSSAFNPTGTPPLAYTPDLLYLMGNISSLTNTRWYLGVPFFNNTPYSLGIVQQGQQILGDNLIAFQAGNEPDLYAQPPRTHRPPGYGPFDYMGDIGMLVGQVANNSLIPKKNNLFVVPSISATVWTPEEVWNTGIVGTYSSSLYGLAVERYLSNNCAARYGIGTAINPQDVFPSYLTHNSSVNLVSSYVNSSQFAMASNKPMLMFETNTASCSGFPGISDSFGAALWSLDWAFMMAFRNFSTALFHVGGQNAYYNPFTPPPTNQSAFRQWTIGPVYYSALVMAEALGPSNASRVLDITQNLLTPIYVIYENGTPTKLAFFNFVTDPSGANDYTATFAVGGGSTGLPGATPSTVKVKYLSAPSVSVKGNFSWGGQTFGNNFESDGRLRGAPVIQTVNCNTQANTCQVKVPAPSFALVFLSDVALMAVSSATLTFPTTVVTRTRNTVYIDPSLLANSNGDYGFQNKKGRTSLSSDARPLRQASSGSFAHACIVAVLFQFLTYLPW